ncbi:MAG: toxin co-regulated pilus biosynthesis Q family protein, partial [Proteobacteria bacterium]|nr:toxin co-regulated pilus biosynthesis Q family protein [Pseudomonadota bacterium]
LSAGVISGTAGAGGAGTITGTGGAGGMAATGATNASGGTDIAVEDAEDNAAAAESKFGQDQVKSWVVASGQTLQSVLQDWCNKEGWDLVWGTNREYPIEASAVFKGRFIDVASALVRNFSRANPIPYAKFYKGNRVVVISTIDGN